MIRKSAWLLSAGLLLLATPAFAQTATSTTDTDKQTGAADPVRRGRRAPSRIRRASSSRSTPATSSSPRLAATRRCPTCRWRSARSPRRTSKYRRDRHPAAQSGCPIAARFLDLVRGGRGGRANPRYRHGRRQSRASKARSACSSTASIARAPALVSPNSARSTGSRCCAGRKARCSAATLRRALFRSSPPSRASTRKSSGQIDVGNYDMRRVKASVTGPLTRHDRGADRWCLARSATVSLRT